MTSEKILPLWDAETIQDKVAALGRRIEEDYEASDPLLISLLGGSVVFVADLIRAVTHPIRFEFVQMQLSPGGRQGEILDVHYPMPLHTEDQRLVILKDVSASGVPESYLATQFLQAGARDVRFAVLIDVPGERKTDFEANYCCFEAERKGPFVGYGLKYQGLYGNLPYIGRLTNEA